jgi:hypothetical protein
MAALGRLGPPIAVMAVIFALSAQPDLSTGLGVWDLIGRKVVHAGAYGLLWFLWWRALGYRRAALAAAVTIGYAVTDEYHQSFVAGRHAGRRADRRCGDRAHHVVGAPAP